MKVALLIVSLVVLGFAFALTAHTLPALLAGAAAALISMYAVT